MHTQTVSDTIRVEDFSTVKSMRIYLPKNTEWYDFWTNQKHSVISLFRHGLQSFYGSVLIETILICVNRA